MPHSISLIYVYLPTASRYDQVKSSVEDGFSLLLIDDNALFLHHATRFLNRKAGLLVVTTAQNGPDGVAKARLHQPDLVLLDLSMPGQSGFETIPQLKKVAPHVRIIVLTMLDGEAYRERALRCGADAYVTKATMTHTLLPEIVQLAGQSLRE